ncbi:hypothetical protein [Flammeovirga sp. SJP92]|uniref:hypothetical protein n=1 Tax=Flammeovirga sp. SJP92 TaxID=1775430 RepID=UPI0007882F02|nr:hypothetical protein [Flammeovirga sp. SJP92]
MRFILIIMFFSNYTYAQLYDIEDIDMKEVGVVTLRKPILVFRKEGGKYVTYITEKKSIKTIDNKKYFDINHHRRNDKFTNKRKRKGQIIYTIKPKNKKLRNKQGIYKFIEYEISLVEYNIVNYGFDMSQCLKEGDYSEILNVLIIDDK